jgi:hypothetical protein
MMISSASLKPNEMKNRKVLICVQKIFVTDKYILYLCTHLNYIKYEFLYKQNNLFFNYFIIIRMHMAVKGLMIAPVISIDHVRIDIMCSW